MTVVGFAMFPTPVGMNRIITLKCHKAKDVPHARGDEPPGHKARLFYL